MFIVVCNNTNFSKLVFDFIAGWKKQIGGKTIVQAGQLPIFRNDDDQDAWLHRPNTILVDSQHLESGEAMSEDFKKIASREIDEFKADYRARFPGRDADNLTDEDKVPLRSSTQPFDYVGGKRDGRPPCGGLTEETERKESY